MSQAGIITNSPTQKSAMDREKMKRLLMILRSFLRLMMTINMMALPMTVMMPKKRNMEWKKVKKVFFVSSITFSLNVDIF